jgi:outer membrane protein TolC
MCHRGQQSYEDIERGVKAKYFAVKKKLCCLYRYNRKIRGLMRIFFIIVMLCPLYLFAGYTLDDLIDVALSNNTTIKQSNLSLNISRARLSSARVNYLPELTGRAGRTESFDNIMFEGRDTQNFVGFSITKNISLNNEDYFTNKNARHDFAAAEISNQIEVQKILFELIQSYISVLENQKKLDLWEQNIAINQKIFDESVVLERNGRITSVDLRQSEINLLNSFISRLNAQNSLSLSRKRLFDLVNIADKGYEIAEVNLYEDTPDFTREINFDSILSVRLQNEAVEKNRTNITTTRLDFLPQMSLRYDYGRTLSSSDFSFDRGRTDHTISLNLSYSLNRLWKNNYTHRQAQYLNQHHLLNTSQLLRDINLRYTQYIEELAYLQQMQVLLENKLEVTTFNREMATERYRLGVLKQLDLDRAIYEYLDTLISQQSNYYQIMLKKLNIDYLLSNLEEVLR